MDIDIVGNVGVRKYTEAKGVAHPSSVVIKQTAEKLPEIKEVTPWLGLLEGVNQSLRLARYDESTIHKHGRRVAGKRFEAMTFCEQGGSKKLFSTF